MKRQTTHSGLTRAATPVGKHEGYMPGFGNDMRGAA